MKKRYYQYAITLLGVMLSTQSIFITSTTALAQEGPEVIRINSVSELMSYGTQGKIVASPDEFNQPINALLHDSFLLETPEGTISLPAGLTISVKGNQAFTVAALGLHHSSDYGFPGSEGHIKFGVDGQYLLFSKPVQITMPVQGVENGTPIGLRVQHEGEKEPGVVGLTNNPNAVCLPDGGVSQEDNINRAIVENNQIMFYTCGASLFIADDTYGTGNPGGFNDYVSHIVIQPDGKAIMGGNFTTYSGVTRNRIVRLNVDGSTDTNFNVGGGFTNTVSSVALQPDGKIILGGMFRSFNNIPQSYISRLNSDGTLDTSFSLAGGGLNGLLRRVALQSDGKILVGGRPTSYNGTPIGYIARLNSDGSLDTSFNPGVGFNGPVSTIVEQPDGKILVGGSFTTFNGISANHIVRLNNDGSIDPSFVYDKGFNGDAQVIVLQPDGKIIVGGFFTSYNNIAQGYITRLLPNGALDTKFNKGGVGFNGKVPVNSIALATNGKIIVAGSFTKYNGIARNYLARLNSNGSLDTSFEIGGGFNIGTITPAIQKDGQILVGGYFTTYDGKTHMRIVRLRPMELPPRDDLTSR